MRTGSVIVKDPWITSSTRSEAGRGEAVEAMEAIGVTDDGLSAVSDNLGFALFMWPLMRLGETGGASPMLEELDREAGTADKLATSNPPSLFSPHPARLLQLRMASIAVAARQAGRQAGPRGLAWRLLPPYLPRRTSVCGACLR